MARKPADSYRRCILRYIAVFSFSLHLIALRAFIDVLTMRAYTLRSLSSGKRDSSDKYELNLFLNHLGVIPLYINAPAYISLSCQNESMRFEAKYFC